MKTYSIVYKVGDSVEIIIDPNSNAEKLLETIKADANVVAIWEGSLLGPSREIWSRN